MLGNELVQNAAAAGCQGHGGGRGCVCRVLRHVWRAGGAATRGLERLRVRGDRARRSRPRRLCQRAALSAHAASSLPLIFSSFYYFLPPPLPSIDMKTKPSHQGRPHGSVAAPGERGRRGQGRVRSGLCAHLEPAGDAPGSSGQRHWLRSAVPARSGAIYGAGDAPRSSLLSRLPAPMYHAMVDFSEKYLER